MKILSVMIEGGARLIQSFIDEGVWDEARVITNSKLISKEPAIASPILTDSRLVDEEMISDDLIRIFKTT